jgi:hypothetical protein
MANQPVRLSRDQTPSGHDVNERSVTHRQDAQTNLITPSNVMKSYIAC